MSAITIHKDNFQEEVLHSDRPVLLDFWASWCGPCRMVSPVIEEIANERTDIKVGKINVDEQEELAAQFQICLLYTSSSSRLASSSCLRRCSSKRSLWIRASSDFSYNRNNISPNRSSNFSFSLSLMYSPLSKIIRSFPL